MTAVRVFGRLQRAMPQRGAETDPLLRKESGVPKAGRTLLLNGVGRQGIDLLTDFAEILRGSNITDELFGAVISDDSRRKEVGQAIGWDFKKTPKAPLFTDQNRAKQAMLPARVHGNLGSVIHLVSFDRHPQQAKDSVFSFTPQASLFHIAVLVRPSPAMERLWYDRGLANLPQEKFVMPLIELDEDKLTELDIEIRVPGWLDSRNAFLHGLAALISGPRLLPHLNRHGYRTVLAELTDNHRAIGAGVGLREVPLVAKYAGLRYDFPQDELAGDVAAAVVDSFTDKAKVTTVEQPSQEAAFEVVAVSLPLGPTHSFWAANPLFATIDKKARQLAGEMSVAMPEKIIYVYGWSPLLGNKRESQAAIVAVRLFAAEPKITREEMQRFQEEARRAGESLG